MALALNTGSSYRPGDGSAELVAKASGRWRISRSRVEQEAPDGGRVLFVARNVVRGVARVVAPPEYDEAGRVTFRLAPEEGAAEALLGQPFPQPWRRGEANPVRSIDDGLLDALLAGAPRRVQLGGVVVVQEADGGLRVSLPAGVPVVVTAL